MQQPLKSTYGTVPGSGTFIVGGVHFESLNLYFEGFIFQNSQFHWIKKIKNTKITTPSVQYYYYFNQYVGMLRIYQRNQRSVRVGYWKIRIYTAR